MPKHADITTDVVAATPPAAVPLTLGDGWTPDRAHAALQADEDPRMDLSTELPARLTAHHPDQA